MSDLHEPQLQTSLSPKLFARDLGQWSVLRLSQSLQAGGKGVLQAGYAIEHAKQLAVSSIRARDSRIGRPFSPFGLGGLTAVIGVGGLLFGHNGLVQEQIAPQIPSVQAQTSNQTAVVKNDLLVDSANVHTTIPDDRLRDSIITHQVQNGDTIESIAKQYNVSVDSLRYVNNLSSQDTVKPGQNLTILPISGVLHVVTKGETLQSIADQWKVPVQAIVDVNWLDEPYSVSVGQKLVIPGAEIPQPTPTPKVNSSALALGGSTPAVSGNGTFIWPVRGQISQYFSYYHNGVDIADHNTNDPIVAAGTGTVTFAGWWDGGGGNSVWIDHGNGYVTMYAHMSKIMTSVGQHVTQGTQIGITGETGRAFGIHLHFMVEYNHKVINPLTVL